jgi:hypothetical protein
MKKIFIKIYNLIPSFVRKSATRHFFKVVYPEKIYKDIIYKIAETNDELKQAFTLIQENYENAKIVGKSTSGLRVTKYNLLPTTTVFIAVLNNEVIGTVSQILDTPMGLPADQISDLSMYREQGARISEISGLVVAKKWRSRNSAIFLALTTSVVNYAHQYLGSQYFVAVTHKRAKFFYEDIFLFKSLLRKKNNYQFVNDTSAHPMIMDANDYPNNFKVSYGNTPPLKNPFNIFTDPVWKSNVILPEKNNFKISHNNISNETLEEFLLISPNLLKEMTIQDQLTIENSHFYTKYKKSFYRGTHTYNRSSARIDTYFEMNLLGETNKVKIICHEVSKKGICLRTSLPLNEGDLFDLEFETSIGKLIIGVEVVWTNHMKVGCIVKNQNKNKWDLFYDNISGQVESDQIVLSKAS